MTGPIPMRLAPPLLLDTGSILGEAADPAAALTGSQYAGRIFYLQRADWAMTEFPDTLSRSEADSYKRHGKMIVLNFEDAHPNWALGGYEVGLDRGDLCAAQLTALDCENAHVYMSVDFHPADAGEMDAVMQCLRGFQDSDLGARGRAVYGFAPVMREAKARDLADYFWMCGDGRDLFTGDWRAGIRDPSLAHVNIWQQNNEQPWFAGVAVDDNYLLTPDDVGQWKPEEKEPDMADPIQDVLTQLTGPAGTGWPILGTATETDPTRHRYLAEAIAVILVQLAGGADFEGWSQLGDGATSTTPTRTLVDAAAHILRQNDQIIAQNTQILAALAALTPKEPQ